MAALKLKIEDFEDRNSIAPKQKSFLSSVKSRIGRQESSPYKTAGTTAYSDTKVFLILQDYLQPDTETTLEYAVQSILALLPDNASLSNEANDLGEVCLELAEQIPYHHPSQIKLARVVEELSLSAKLTDEPDSQVR